jgi:hypothetical protein
MNRAHLIALHLRNVFNELLHERLARWRSEPEPDAHVDRLTRTNESAAPICLQAQSRTPFAGTTVFTNASLVCRL